MNYYSPYPWALYSKKLSAKILRPQFAGYFRGEDFPAMRLVIGREGSKGDGNCIALYWLVDETDGVIADVRYQVFGTSALVGALEAACQLMIRKTYEQARRITADLIDRELRDKNDQEAFPVETYGHINLVLSAIEHGADQCVGIPCEEIFTTSPLHPDLPPAQIYPGWDTFSKKEKVRAIEEVIHQEIRPYIELDAGGIQIIDLLDSLELIITYQGACTSCPSSTGSTLSAIQQILQTRVHPHITVTPDISFLTQHEPSGNRSGIDN